jgi:TolB-like protein/DNA-binding winged helix-turn-helix (wHTH) protein/tetratricopeptide (TPR) repeat protein
LDPESGDLKRGGVRTRLQEQPVLLLKELIAHAGEVVTREHLIGILWPKGVVDFDTGLNTAVRKLRNALGDTADTPRYIETLPRRGYRFIGALDADPEAPSAASPTVPVSSASGASAGPASSWHREPTALPDVVVPAPVPSGSEPADPEEETSSIATRIAPTQRPRLPAMALITALAGAALLTGVYALWRQRSGASVTSVRVEAPSQSRAPANIAPSRAFNPPPHSIAVLPFVNLSGDKEQEYFSDGLTEELLNSFAHIDGLQVAARTSSFSFREHPNVADVAHKLNVATVLEGSVRRSGHTIRISAQLINAATGFHLWSKTYDRDLGDVLKLQTEIATAVASALEVRLLGDVGAKIELGSTRNPAAFDAYLRAQTTHEFGHFDPKDLETAIAGYSEAIRLDPNYALAFAGRSIAWNHRSEANGATAREDIEKALADARRAVTLAPELAESHLALHLLFNRELDFAQASVELQRAVALAPGNAQVLARYGRFAVLTGRTDAGVAAARRAVILDPLNVQSHSRLGSSLYFGRRYAEAVAVFSEVLALDSQVAGDHALRGLAYYGLGDFERARASCDLRPDEETSQLCLAITYQRLARRADAEIAFAKLRSAGDRMAYHCAAIYAQWGNTSQALQSLESAWRLRVPELRWLKADPLMDPLRKEPRFQAIERALKFPN